MRACGGATSSNSDCSKDFPKDCACGQVADTRPRIQRSEASGNNPSALRPHALSRREWSPRPLNGWPALDCIVPSLHVGIVRKPDLLHAMQMDVRIHCHVCDGI